MKVFNILAWLVIIVLSILFLSPWLSSLWNPPPGIPSYKYVKINNMKQITTMMIKHRADTRDVWPNPWKEVGVEFPKVESGEDAKMITAIMFEYLASVHELHPDLFNDPETGSPGLEPSRRSAKEIIENPNIDWAENYALDWSAPKTAGTARPIMCLRQPIGVDSVFIYADTHIDSDGEIKEVLKDESEIRTAQKGEKRLSVMIGDDDIYAPQVNDDGSINKAAFTFGANTTNDIWMK